MNEDNLKNYVRKQSERANAGIEGLLSKEWNGNEFIAKDIGLITMLLRTLIMIAEGIESDYYRSCQD